jgi:hypothetical protein
MCFGWLFVSLGFAVVLSWVLGVSVSIPLWARCVLEILLVVFQVGMGIRLLIVEDLWCYCFVL